MDPGCPNVCRVMMRASMPSPDYYPAFHVVPHEKLGRSHPGTATVGHRRQPELTPPRHDQNIYSVFVLTAPSMEASSTTRRMNSEP